MKDKLLKKLEYLMSHIKEENLRQIAKWGIQDRTPFEWMTFLTEEVGELAEAISECEFRQAGKIYVFQEAIQTATLAIKIAEMYSQEVKDEA